jgi:hypothetical protein
MKYNVTVDQAIARGRKLCVFLPGILLFSFMLGSPFVYAFTKNAWFLITGIVLGFLLSWFSWAFFVVRWRIWAYSNVRNIHELKKRAIERQIMHKDGHFINKTEIKTAQQRYILQQLEVRFKERDIFKDDEDVPNETYIYLSKNKIYSGMVAGVLVFGLGVYILCITDNLKDRLFSLLLMGVGIFMVRQDIKKLRHFKPVMVLSDEGIRLQGRPLLPWNVIYNDLVMPKSDGREKKDVLEFQHPGGFETIEIEAFKIKKDRLRHLLKVYRGRFEEKNNTEL